MNNFFYFFKKINLLKNFRSQVLVVPLLLIIILSMMILPLPTFLLDLFFTFNISLSLLILLVSLFNKYTLDFSSFPTILLFSTLLRLSLNIASTRIILLHGHTGIASAGHVIESFGNFLVGGNFFIGIVVFIILIIINFIVITKGAGRIAEVGARFALDGMPGKQMAIDADLNAGLIGETEAKKRRMEITREAEFYGSMDGASKFVRGDAIAGILIMFVNVIGGLFIGILQHNLVINKALESYTILTIGDGLVAQIPALIISTAVGVIVTRVKGDENVGDQMIKQLFFKPVVIILSGCLLFILGIVPGMPNLIFLLFSLSLFFLSWFIYNKNIFLHDDKVYDEYKKNKEYLDLSWKDVQIEDTIRIEFGKNLTPILEKKIDSLDLLNRIKNVRKKCADDFGFLPPAIVLSNNFKLSKNVYRICIKGISISEGEIFLDKVMALDSGHVTDTLEGKRVKEPTFGMQAIWINKNFQKRAEELRYIIITPSVVIATHLNFVIQNYLHELFGRYEVNKLLDRVNQELPNFSDDLIPSIMTLTTFHKILKNLLLENVSIKDIRTIIETLIEYAPGIKDINELTSMIRITLGKSIVQNIFQGKKSINVIGINSDIENILSNSIKNKEKSINQTDSLEPEFLNNFFNQVKKAIIAQDKLGDPIVLLVPHVLREFLVRILKPKFSNIIVLSDVEIRDSRKIFIKNIIGNME
ncbi:flagellar biosynthesis protein FlhA [Buchnera aphidicola (Kurisakia onigurumii)]|uniref:flagellar biosynthesis protein FlhA n=1 Tax=Buchnera aphidicola TaxID=9 RepID=UPI0031B69265